MTSIQSAKPLRVLMELRPCFDGYAGIPQETRLLFGAFAALPEFSLGGLLNGGESVGDAAIGTRDGAPPAEAVYAQAARLIALDIGGDKLTSSLPARAVRRFLPRRLSTRFLAFRHRGLVERLDGIIDPVLFNDWLWDRLFRLGLRLADRPLIDRAEYPVPQLSWGFSLELAKRGDISRVALDLASSGWDIYIAQTPSPYRLIGGRMIVRYHDAVPLLWPHTIQNAGTHASEHHVMLRQNVADGAWFACTSGPVREDLLRLYPEVADRSSVIPTMSSGSFGPDPRPPREIASITRRGRAAAAAKREHRSGSPDAHRHEGHGASGSDRDREMHEPFVLAVSTLEPRKNYAMLLRAAADARRRGAKFRLTVVASLGWRSERELALLDDLVREGVVDHLADVETDDLRALYSAAHLVVCPSRAEGFDLATVEAMACGTPVLASDIPVHRWVCGDAAEYFDAYDSPALARTLSELTAMPKDEGRLAELSTRGLARAALYRPAVLTSKWEALLDTVGRSRPISQR